MPLYVSETLDSHAFPETLRLCFGDNVKIRGNWYRLASAEWLTWLRTNSRAGVSEKRALQGRLREHCPELIGVSVELPNGYEPPGAGNGHPN